MLPMVRLPAPTMSISPPAPTNDPENTSYSPWGVSIDRIGSAPKSSPPPFRTPSMVTVPSPSSEPIVVSVPAPTSRLAF